MFSLHDQLDLDK